MKLPKIQLIEMIHDERMYNIYRSLAIILEHEKCKQKKESTIKKLSKLVIKLFEEDEDDEICSQALVIMEIFEDDINVFKNKIEYLEGLKKVFLGDGGYNELL